MFSSKGVTDVLCFLIYLFSWTILLISNVYNSDNRWFVGVCVCNTIIAACSEYITRPDLHHLDNGPWGEEAVHHQGYDQLPPGDTAVSFIQFAGHPGVSDVTIDWVVLLLSSALSLIVVNNCL